MRRLSKGFCATFVLILSACEGWPPNDVDLRTRFLENRSIYDDLRARIFATDYVSASLYRTDGSLMMSFVKDAYDPRQGVYQLERERSSDTGWVSLMEKGRVLVVEQREGVVSIEPSLPWTIESMPVFRRSDRMVAVRFTHHAEEPWAYPVCKPEHEDLRCGDCAVPLADEWFIRYWWAPIDVIPEISKRYVEGDIPLEEFEPLLSQAMEQCFRDGLQAIGHE